MKGKISDGELYIERNDKMLIQSCPYQAQKDMACGQWCPLFGEPIKISHGLKIDLCKRTLFFDELDVQRY